MSTLDFQNLISELCSECMAMTIYIDKDNVHFSRRTLYALIRKYKKNLFSNVYIFLSLK